MLTSMYSDHSISNRVIWQGHKEHTFIYALVCIKKHQVSWIFCAQQFSEFSHLLARAQCTKIFRQKMQYLVLPHWGQSLTFTVRKVKIPIRKLKWTTALQHAKANTLTNHFTVHNPKIYRDSICHSKCSRNIDLQMFCHMWNNLSELKGRLNWPLNKCWLLLIAYPPSTTASIQRPLGTTIISYFLNGGPDLHR